MGSKFQGKGDHRAAIGSPEYLKWLESLPPFLRDTVAQARGIALIERNDLTSSLDKDKAHA